MSSIAGETAYLFRHAILRDAAYQLQLPGDRARLHALALRLIENQFGGSPPALPAPAGGAPAVYAPHPIDPFASELAEHAKAAIPVSEEYIHIQCEYLQRAALHATHGYLPIDAARSWLALADLRPGIDEGSCARLAGVEWFRAGRINEAKSAFERSLEVAKNINAGNLEAEAKAGLGGVMDAMGSTDAAAELFREAMDLGSALGDRYIEATSMGNLASMLSRTRRFREAEPMFVRAIEVHRLAGNIKSEALVKANFGLACQQQGRAQEAERLLSEALVSVRALNERRTEGIVLLNLALMWQESGRLELARETYGPAINILRQTGALSAEAHALSNFAGLLAQTGQGAQAEPLFLRAHAIVLETGNRAQETRMCGELGVLYYDMGQLGKSESMFVRAIELARAGKDAGAEGTALGNLAHLQCVQGRLVEAEAAFSSALKIHRTLGARRMAAIHGCRYALCLLALGNASAAQQEYTDGMATLRELNDTLEIGRTQKEMLRACEKLGVAPLKDNEPGTP